VNTTEVVKANPAGGGRPAISHFLENAFVKRVNRRTPILDRGRPDVLGIGMAP
jgi:hypothetical protein